MAGWRLLRAGSVIAMGRVALRRKRRPLPDGREGDLSIVMFFPDDH